MTTDGEGDGAGPAPFPAVVHLSATGLEDPPGGSSTLLRFRDSHTTGVVIYLLHSCRHEVRFGLLHNVDIFNDKHTCWKSLGFK